MIRGIPLLVLIIWVYFGLPLFLGIDPQRFTNFRAGVISLTVFHTAFMAEVFRTGLTAVPPGQREAALSLGMSRPRAFVSIILPQAVRVAVPAAGNDFVGMVKDTSLVGIIGIFELYRTGQELVSDTFRPFEVWTGVSILYITIVFCIDIVVRLVERRLRPGSRARGLFGRRRNAAVDAVVRRVSGIAPRCLHLSQSTQQPRRSTREELEDASHRSSAGSRRRRRGGLARRLAAGRGGRGAEPPGDLG